MEGVCVAARTYFLRPWFSSRWMANIFSLSVIKYTSVKNVLVFEFFFQKNKRKTLRENPSDGDQSYIYELNDILHLVFLEVQ